jgi:PAS domain S-box-containing protein
LKDEEKTRDQLLGELSELRRRVQELESPVGDTHVTDDGPRESEEHFRLLIENICEIISIIDAEGTIIYMSPSNEKFSGYKSEELVGRNSLEFIHPDDSPGVVQALTALVREPGSTGKVEYRIRHKDGSWRYVQAMGINLLDHPSLSAIVVNATDLTDFKLAEQALREEKDFTDNALNSLKDIFYVLGADARLLRWNKAFKEVSGYSDEELSSMAVFDFFEGEDQQRQDEFYQVLLEEGQAGIEALGVTKDGRRIPYYLFSTLLRDGEGNPVAVCGVGRDISERKRADEELQRYRVHLEELVEERTLEIMRTNERLQEEITERGRVEEQLRARNLELDAFAHNVSHDLRGSLALIDGFACTAINARNKGSVDEENECLVKIVQAAQRMDNFIDSLLDYSRAGHRGGTERVELDEVLVGVLAEHEGEINRRKADIVIQGKFPAVSGEPVKLHQVLSNLLGNALKFLGDNPEPRVEIGWEEKEGGVTVSVKDNGIGVSEQELEMIFEPFTRCGGAKFPGLGIGLATVKRAVERWGGEVWVESRPGEGSTFFFTVPATGA